MEKLSGKANNSLRNVFHRFGPELWLVTATQFFIAMGFSICIPFLSLYLFQDRDLSMTMVGTILLAAGLCSAASQAIGGALSDRFGRRPILLIGTAVSVFMFSGLAALIGISAPVWAIAVVYIASRLILTTTRPVIQAMVADFTPKEKLTEAYGILRIGANLGWAAGPAIGGFLLTFLPYGWLFGVAPLACGIVFFIIFFFIRESSHAMSGGVDFRSMLTIIANDRPFRVFVVISILLFIAMGQMVSTLSIFTVDKLQFSFAQFGLILALNGLIVVFFQYPMTVALRRIAKFRALILGSLLYVFGYLSLGWITQFGWVLVAMAVITGGEIIHAPVSLSVIGELSPEDKRGRYMGLFGLSQTIGIAVGPLIGGVLIDAFPFNYVLIWAPIALVAFIAAIGYYWWGRRFPL
jgi:MFS family permease